MAAKLKKYMEDNQRLSSAGSSVSSETVFSPRPSVTDPSSVLSSYLDNPQVKVSIGSDVSPFSLASTATNTPSPAIMESVEQPDTVKMVIADSEDEEMDGDLSPHHLAPTMNSSLHNTSIFGIISSGEEVLLDNTPIFTNPIDSSLEDDREEDNKRLKTSEEEYVVRTTEKNFVEDPVVRISVPEFSNNFMMPTTASLNKIQSPSPRYL